MAIKYIFLLIFAFILEIAFLSKDLRFQDTKLSTQDIDVEFTNSKTYSINQNNIDTILISEKIWQLKNKKIFFKPIATLYDADFTKTITANKATYFDINETILLKDKVNIIYGYKRLSTNMILYDFKNKLILDSSKFSIKSNSFIAFGNHLYFDIKHNIIKAKEINYKFNTKE